MKFTSLRSIFLPSLLITFFTLVLFFNVTLDEGQHFTFLASSFLRGKLYLVNLDQFGTLDTVFSQGRYYWHLGPFPAILLAPFVFIFERLGIFFRQGYLQFFVTLGIFYFCYKLGRIFKYSHNDSLILSFAFCFSSIYIAIAFNPTSWFFSHSLVVFFLTLSFWEFFSKKRYWMVGLFLSFVFATRFTAGLLIIFFLLVALGERLKGESFNYLTIFNLLAPAIIVGSLLLNYNLVRFGSPFDNGYLSSKVAPEFQEIARQKSGLFSLKNIPTNFYWYFLATPKPVLGEGTYALKPPYLEFNLIGLSFFIVSPIFLRLFLGTWKTRQQKLLWLASIIILFILLTYFANGYEQIGPRYMLDILPIWYILLLTAFKDRKLKNMDYWVIIVSGLFNLSLVLPYSINFLIQ